MAHKGSFDVDWVLTWGGFANLTCKFTINAKVEDDLSRVYCWIDLDTFNQWIDSSTLSGNGFFNAGGLMWDNGYQKICTGRHFDVQDDYDNDTVSHVESDLELMSGLSFVNLPSDMIVGFYASDNSTVHDVRGLFDEQNLCSEDNPRYFDLPTDDTGAHYLPRDMYIVRGFSRWLNQDPTAEGYEPDHPFEAYVGNIGIGNITLEDIFSDYYPWAILKDANGTGSWKSANRDSGSHKMLVGEYDWRDDKNNFLTYKDQTVYQLKSGFWSRCDEIGAE